MRKRRYELRVPVGSADDSWEDPRVRQTREELLKRFGRPGPGTRGVLRVGAHSGEATSQRFVELVLDTDDTPETQAFFTGYQRVLLERFAPSEIHITSFPVDVL
ncbi:MAG TPA: hypothetical protein VKA46_13275 [Gemmataceae bacterium]|nr:hypothetical protein [Gemmataceae bacterium]